MQPRPDTTTGTAGTGPWATAPGPVGEPAGPAVDDRHTG